MGQSYIPPPIVQVAADALADGGRAGSQDEAAEAPVPYGLSAVGAAAPRRGEDADHSHNSRVAHTGFSPRTCGRNSGRGRERHDAGHGSPPDAEARGDARTAKGVLTLPFARDYVGRGIGIVTRRGIYPVGASAVWREGSTRGR